MDKKTPEVGLNESGEKDEFKTRLIPEQAKQPVAPIASSSPYFSQPSSVDLLSVYSIKSKIGVGGMGSVYLALDRRLGRYVAIKRLKAELRDELAVRRRFLHEAKAAAALNNVHIVHIYSIGEDSAGPYIVMEYVESALPKTDISGPCPPQSLEQYVNQNGPFKLDDALSFLLKIGHAIEAAHAGGVIHRDLKPSNILMDAAGEPKIVDFGLARLTRPDEVSDLTVKGDKFISLGYGAPEQESDATLSDERADVYGLGALLYFSLSGKNPRFFREEDLPTSVRPLVCKALATERAMRYQTVASFDAALTALLVEAKTERPTVKTTWRCKWCDTINPLSTRFCGECGWDGRELCRECGEDQQVGTLFCGVCGANAREYESTFIMLRKIRNAIESHQYEWAVNVASQPMTFDPVGPNGRQMRQEIQSLGETAQKRHQRREQLRAIIATEMAAENFERARRFIQEFRELSSSQDAFFDELSSIPAKILTRDLLRVNQAFMAKDWDLGERLLYTMSMVDDDGMPERARLLRVLGRHKRHSVLAKFVGITSFLAVLYLLITPVMIRLDLPGARAIGRPMLQLSRMPRIGAAITGYLSLWDVKNFEEYFSGKEKIEPVSLCVNEDKALTPTLSLLQKEFNLQMKAVENDLSITEKEWAGEYVRALTKLREQSRADGSFDGWKLVDQELMRFSESRVLLPESTKVASILASTQATFRLLRDKRRAPIFRKQVAVTRAYIEDLHSHVTELTKSGEMTEAEFFSGILKSTYSDPRYLDAEAALAQYDARNPEGTISNYNEIVAESHQSDIILNPRNQYEEAHRKAVDDYASAVERWQSDYLKALEELSGQRQREGDFIGLQLSSAEMSRFELNREVSESIALSESTHLNQLRDRFRKQRVSIEDSFANAVVSAANTFDETLAELASRHTKAGEIEAAALAMSERRHLATRSEVVASRERLATKNKTHPRK